MLKETITKNKVILRKDCLTTTELAKLCGVSRFTIINWVNRGKIRTMKTVGGHCRIPVSEAISFYETFHKGKSGVTSESLCHCWEYPQKANCDKECKNCLLYGSRINYCFVVAREFGKELIRCKGDCSNCDYFEEFFSSYSKNAQLNETHEAKGVKVAKDKKNFLYNVVYGVGRGIQEVKGRVTDIKEVFGVGGSRTKQMEDSNA
ncbi:MAG: helix-turn-helix domain-containing protein [Planctomycetes bacterium]|nr:helix-turn-helix domain-containing protein [Planctomycetota bacterium]